MNNISKTIVILGVVIGLLFLGGTYFFSSSDEQNVGSGYTHYQNETFLQGLGVGSRDQFEVSNTGALTSSAAATFSGSATFSGAVTHSGNLTATGDTKLSSTVIGGDVTVLTGGSTTTSAAEVCDSSVIQLDPEGSITLTLPTTANLVADCLATNGDTHKFVLENTANGAENITVAAGTGMDLQEPDGQNVVIGQNNMAIIEIANLDGTNSITFVTETIPAD